jgi:hypothetical protein
MENKEFLSKEQCEALNELNYDGDYDFVYHATGEIWERGKKDKKERFVPAPLKQQVFRWFRKKYEWYANLSSWLHEEEIGTYHEFEIYGVNQYAHGSVPFKTYEEAENAAINKLLELAKQQ